MKPLILNRATFVWFGLVLATCLSWWMGTGLAASPDPRFVASALIVVALVKVRFVVRYFMEVRVAAPVLKWMTDGWVVLVCGALLVLYWQGA